MQKFILSIGLLISFNAYSECNTSIAHASFDNRYEILNNGDEVKDKKTNLIWQRCTQGETWDVVRSNCVGTPNRYNWVSALQAVKNLGNGWRIPNIKELSSLVHDACYSPSINTNIFPSTQNTYWSSSPVFNKIDSVWAVGFSTGGLGAISKTNNSYVRVVKSNN